MNPRQPAADPAADAASAGRVRDAANADVRHLLRGARRRRHARWLAGGLVVVAAGAVLTMLIRAGTFDSLVTQDAAVSPVGTSAPVTSTPPTPMFDPLQPFASTPAAGWADGAAGIVAPVAKPVGEFSASQVAEAMTRVRDVLVASRLDRRLLVGHDPARFLSLLAPDARTQLEPLFHGREPEVQSLVSMVASNARLLPVEAKVQGEMSVTEGETAGELVVRTNYVFVYAFEPEEPVRLVDAMNLVVVVRADVTYVLRAGDRWTEGSQGLWYDDATGYAYSIGCEAYQKGYLAPAVTERAVTTKTARAQATYFEPRSPAPPPSCPN